MICRKRLAPRAWSNAAALSFSNQAEDHNLITLGLALKAFLFIQAHDALHVIDLGNVAILMEGIILLLLRLFLERCRTLTFGLISYTLIFLMVILVARNLSKPVCVKMWARDVKIIHFFSNRFEQCLPSFSDLLSNRVEETRHTAILYDLE